MPENFPSSKTEIVQRLQAVVSRVRAAEHRFGREPESVHILPVSKMRPANDIQQIACQGFKAFGESYLQEAEDKITALAALQLEWHFVGPIQSNKTQSIAKHFHWVHGVGRVKIAQRLNDQRPKAMPPLNVCLQVNVSGEISKSGVMLDELLALAKQVMLLPHLRLRGLMAIPARTDDFKAQRAAFLLVCEAFNSIKLNLDREGENQQLQAWDTLSMGMSGDLEAAIAEGATIVRVGTDIFGPRLKK